MYTSVFSFPTIHILFGLERKVKISQLDSSSHLPTQLIFYMQYPVNLLYVWAIILSTSMCHIQAENFVHGKASFLYFSLKGKSGPHTRIQFQEVPYSIFIKRGQIISILLSFSKKYFCPSTPPPLPPLLIYSFTLVNSLLLQSLLFSSPNQ